MAEMKRATSRKMVCTVCRQPGKYIGCGVSSCPKGGHFPCLVSADFLFQHCDAFRAFCPRHAPTQCPLSGPSERCCICLASLSPPSLYCPSCKTVFHKSCIQVSTHYLIPLPHTPPPHLTHTHTPHTPHTHTTHTHTHTHHTHLTHRHRLQRQDVTFFVAQLATM